MLQSGGGLRFTVVDPQGELLPEARAVVVGERDSWTLGMYLLMDLDHPRLAGGAARRRALHDRQPGRRGVEPPGAGPRLPHRILPVDLPAGGKLDLGKLMLEPAQRVKGRVVDAGGDPVADAPVQLQLVAGSREAPEYVGGEMLVTDEKVSSSCGPARPKASPFRWWPPPPAAATAASISSSRRARPSSCGSASAGRSTAGW